MQTAKIFTSGRSQAVRLPKQFRFNSEEVTIRHFGNGVLLLPKENPWQLMQEAVHEFESNFVLERAEQTESTREAFL